MIATHLEKLTATLRAVPGVTLNFEAAVCGGGKLSGGKLSVYVSPVIVPQSSPLASAKGPGNMVVVNGVKMVQSTFAGPGAGR